jgi:hypothetical protein
MLVWRRDIGGADWVVVVATDPVLCLSHDAGNFGVVGESQQCPVDVLDIDERERTSGRAELDRPFHRFDVSEDFGGASVLLSLVGLPGGPCESLVREVNAFDPGRRDALRSQQVLRQGSEGGDAGQRCLQMLKRPTRVSHGRNGGAVKREVAAGDLVRDEDFVSAGPSCPAAPIGSWVSRPDPLLESAEWGSLNMLRGGRGRKEILSELGELCKDSA